MLESASAYLNSLYFHFRVDHYTCPKPTDSHLPLRQRVIIPSRQLETPLKNLVPVLDCISISELTIAICPKVHKLVRFENQRMLVPACNLSDTRRYNHGRCVSVRCSSVTKVQRSFLPKPQRLPSVLIIMECSAALPCKKYPVQNAYSIRKKKPSQDIFERSMY